MNRVERCTRELIQAILESEEYVHFSEIKEKLRGEPELHRQVSEFRMGVFEIQNSTQPLDMYGEQQRLCREGEQFRKNPLVDDFLRTELSVCRILQKTAEDIVDAIDLDMDEIVERIGL